MPDTSELSTAMLRQYPGVMVEAIETGEARPFVGLHAAMSAERIMIRAGELAHEAEHNPMLPARAWDALKIQNGDYRVWDHNRGTGPYLFRIHLVQNGPLAGQRIIKHRPEGASRYAGFAFLTRTGQLTLWTRFAHHAEEPYVEAAAKWLLLLSAQDDDREIAWHRWAANGIEASLVVPRCSLCNTPCSRMPGQVNLCQTHADRYYIIPNYLAEQAYNNLPTYSPFQGHHPFEVVGVINADELREDLGIRPDLLYCENGTGEVI